MNARPPDRTPAVVPDNKLAADVVPNLKTSSNTIRTPRPPDLEPHKHIYPPTLPPDRNDDVIDKENDAMGCDNKSVDNNSVANKFVGMSTSLGKVSQTSPREGE